MELDFGRVLGALPAMVLTALPDGHIDFVNRRWSEYTGLSLQDAIGRGWQEAVDPDDLAEFLKLWQSILASGKTGEMEGRLRRDDGQCRWFSFRWNPICDDGGRIVGWCAAATDVDDLKRAQAALRESERNSYSILDSIPGLVAVFTTGGELERVNERVLEFYGKTLDELKTWETSKIAHPEDLSRVLEVIARSRASGDPVELEIRSRRFDGVYRWLQCRAFPLRDSRGSIVSWFIWLIDMEDRKRAEETLRESEFESRLIVDNVPALIAISTPTGAIEFYNRQTQEYTGRSVEEMQDWDTIDAVHPEDLAATLDSYTTGIRSGNPFQTLFRMRRFDGVYRWFEGRCMPMKNAEDLVVRWIISFTDVDDRKRAETALAASERSLKQIVDTIPVLAWSAQLDGSADFFNQHYLDYVGLDAEQAQGSGWTVAVHAEDLGPLVSTWQAIMASEMPGEAEARLRQFDGVYRWFLFRVNPLRNASGSVVKWYGTNIDIEDRKRAAEALRGRERDLELTVNTIPVMAWSARPDGSPEFFNQHYLHYVGLSIGQSRDWSPTMDLSEYWDLTASVHPQDVSGLVDKWQAVLASGEAGEMEARLRRYDGSYRWFLFRANPLREESGTIVRWYGTNTDIDDRKQAEEALKRSKAFLAEGQHLARMGNFSWHVETGEILWSEPLHRIFEFASGAPVTLDLIATRIHPEDLPLMGDMVDRAQRGESGFEYQHRILLPDQSVKHLHLIAHRAANQSGQTEYIGAVLDITQRRLSEEALEKVRSELAHATRIMSLGVLTASIAHEVNQPLSGIVTNAGTCLRMLAADPPNVDGARETARRTIRDGNRAADVIARLRALFGNKAIAIEPVDLNEASREVIALLWSDLQRSRVMLRTEFTEKLPHVAGDRVQLQQVIMNLMRNAADAMDGVEDRARQVLIRTDADDEGRVRLSVKDAGVGFGSEGADRLFEAFYTTKSSGMGIGLSVSRSIIESHDGRLWAEAHDGPGATLSFSVPLYPRDETHLHGSGAMLAPGTASARVQRGFYESY